MKICGGGRRINGGAERNSPFRDTFLLHLGRD